jgi:hypothetical protein
MKLPLRHRHAAAAALVGERETCSVNDYEEEGLKTA